MRRLTWRQMVHYAGAAERRRLRDAGQMVTLMLGASAPHPTG